METFWQRNVENTRLRGTYLQPFRQCELVRAKKAIARHGMENLVDVVSVARWLDYIESDGPMPYGNTVCAAALGPGRP